jgi:hypothetical protein
MLSSGKTGLCSLTGRLLAGWQTGNDPETGLEEINSDLLGADFCPVAISLATSGLVDASATGFLAVYRIALQPRRILACEGNY